MIVCMYVCRTRPTFCVFLFWYRFQNKTTHFPRCRRNSIFFFLSFVSFLFSCFIRGLSFCAATSQHFVYTILFIYLPLLVNFILHLTRTHTNTHSNSHSQTLVCLHVHTFVCIDLCTCVGGTRTCDFLEFIHFCWLFL